MKKILTLILIVSASYCYGQDSSYKWPSIKHKVDSAVSLTIDSFGIAKYYIGLDSLSYKVSYDTVPCIMLVCDTAFYMQHTVAYIRLQDDAQQAGRLAFWIRGYIATKSKYSGVYIEKTYIDADKKPLSKNIVVWLSK